MFLSITAASETEEVTHSLQPHRRRKSARLAADLFRPTRPRSPRVEEQLCPFGSEHPDQPTLFSLQEAGIGSSFRAVFSVLQAMLTRTDQPAARSDLSAARHSGNPTDRPTSPARGQISRASGGEETLRTGTRELRARGAAARSVCGWGAGRLALALETNVLTHIDPRRYFTQNAGFRRGATLNMGRHHPLQITSEGDPFKLIKPGNVAIRARVDTHVATQTARHGKSHSLGAGRHSTLWRYTAR